MQEEKRPYQALNMQKKEGIPLTRRSLFKLAAGMAATASLGFPHLVKAEKDSRVIIAYGASQERMDPHQHYHTITESVLRNIYEPLLRRSRDLKTLEPALAVSYTTLNDKTWQFKLRQGVKFHNGEEFDAETVKFSLERLLNPPADAHATSRLLIPTYNTIDHVEVADRYTVNIVTKIVDPYLDAKMSGFGANMVPRHYIQEKGYGVLLTDPVGTGPYKFVSWVKDGDTTLEAFEGYWGGPASIKTAIIRPIPEGATRAAALKAGEVDVVQNLPPSEVEPVKASGIAQPVSVPSVRVMFVQLDSFRGPTQDKRVRQALNYAVDVPELIEFVLGGNGIQIADFLSPLIFGHDPKLEPYPYDPDKAKQLLAEAGYPDGFEIGFDCSRGRYLQDKEIAEAMAGQLAKVGIRARVVAHEWALYVSKMSAYQNAPLSLWGWGNWTLDADNSLYPRMHCPGSIPPKTSIEAYCNKELDAVLEEARSIIDREKRLALYSKAQKIVLEDPPFIFLYQLRDLYGVSNRLKWTPRSDEMIWAYEMALA